MAAYVDHAISREIAFYTKRGFMLRLRVGQQKQARYDMERNRYRDYGTGCTAGYVTVYGTKLVIYAFNSSIFCCDIALNAPIN